MQIVKKRNAKSSRDRLVSSMERFIELLKEQKEDKAIEDLKRALTELKKYDTTHSINLKEALELILATFNGEHELNVYMSPSKKEKTSWNIREELYIVSTEVFSIANRMLQTEK